MVTSEREWKLSPKVRSVVETFFRDLMVKSGMSNQEMGDHLGKLETKLQVEDRMDREADTSPCTGLDSSGMG